MEEHELPRGWVWTTLEKIGWITKLAGFEFTNYFKYQDSGPVRVVRGLNVGFGKFKDSDFKYIDEQTSDALPRSQLKGGELLMAYVGTIGTVAILPKNNYKYHLGPNVCKIVLDMPESSSFTKYYLMSPTGQELIKNTSKAVAQSSLSMEQIRAFRIPLPSLPEQQRIVSAIEQQFTRLDEGVAALRRAQAKLKRYRAAVLKAAVEGELTKQWRAEHPTDEPASMLLERVLDERRPKWEADLRAKGKDPAKVKYVEPVAPDVEGLPELPEGWCWATVEQVTAAEQNAITDGPFGSNLKTEHYKSEGGRVIRLQNVGDGEFRDEKAFIALEHFERLRKHRVFAGDLVIAALGENPPRSCIIPEFVGPAIVKADCIRCKISPHILNTFVNSALNAEPTRKRTASKLHGVGRPRLNLAEIKSITIPLPSLAEQQQIVAEVEHRLSVISTLEATV